MRFDNILESIGGTPHIRLSLLFPEHEVWIKDERRNPGGSIKDRIAYAMITEAEKEGKLSAGGVIIEPTSGNTGIGLALAGAVKGYRVILVMPDSMSEERRKLLAAYGAEVILTPGEMGMKGSIAEAEKMKEKLPGSWMPMQFSNPANPGIHYRVTAREIIADFPEGFDYLVAGVGSGGHLTGVGKKLKERFPAMKIFAVEPAESPVLSGGASGAHKIQGIGAGFVPDNLSKEIVDNIITVTGDDAIEMQILATHREGLFAGISTGASLAAIKSLSDTVPTGSRIITFSYDTGERYLSTGI